MDDTNGLENTFEDSQTLNQRGWEWELCAEAAVPEHFAVRRSFAPVSPSEQQQNRQHWYLESPLFLHPRVPRTSPLQELNPSI